MALINLSHTLELKSGKIFTKNVCDVFVCFEEMVQPSKNFLVICDEGTKYIAERFSANPFQISTIPELEKKLEDCEGIFAIGSGTVCDYAKFASFKAKKPFVMYGTALSMNGYLSSTASIINANGAKESIKCHLPKALYFDLSVLQNAPIELTKAGFGDAMARASAQSDCLLSHKHKKTEYREELFNFRLPSEQFLLNNYQQLTQKDDEFFFELLENTLFAGFSMHLNGSSFTASGGEHAMAHYGEMHFPSIKKFLHGLQISAFTCEMLKIQNSFKEEKTFTYNQDLEKIFKALEMPSSFADLGLSLEDFEKIKIGGANIRDRFGFLNLS